jgi:glycosyltransferase involved in cell wall biosynthesis
MKISGFTMVRNATRLCYPVKESIASILPVVDEFIVALGKGDEEDRTEQEILSLNDPKIKIIPRVWDPELFLNSEIFRHETNVALKECSGDWCFYIQADEVVHEEDLPYIYNVCHACYPDPETEGILFRYHHFWGDYQHYLPFHNWYRNEIRIVRNHIGVQSVKDAQSFRIDNRKLKVVASQARIFHYGWVRPPKLMKTKKREHDNIHRGKSEKLMLQDYFDYGNMSAIPVYNGTHPRIMSEKIKEHNWQHLLRYSEKGRERPLLKHEKWHYRLVSWFENSFLKGKQLWGYKNWKVIKRM